jgi:tetratricopeptide (TPR) repeat protein
MVQGVLHADALPAELEQLIAARAEGNPFFVEEVIKSLLETGAVRRRNGTYELARPADQISIPETLQDVILTRIDRLEREAREALQLASVIGREFTVRLLQRIADIGAELDGTLGELKSLELIYEKSYFPELAYMFKHAVTHEVALSMLLSDRRKRMHLLVATAIEELYADRLAEHYETLAHHYDEGEDWAKALEYTEKAAGKAAAAFANLDAAELYGRAIELASRAAKLYGRVIEAASRDDTVSPDRLSDLYWRRGKCYLNLGQWGPARDDGERALELLGPEQAETRATIQLDLSLAKFYLLDAPAALVAAEEAKTIADRIGRVDLRVRAIAMMAGAVAAHGDLPLAYSMFQEALDDATSLNSAPVLQQVVAFYPLALYWGGSIADAIDRATQSRRAGFDLDDVTTMMNAVPHLALALAAAGRYREAVETFEEACAIGRKRNVQTLLARALAMYGGMHLDLFDYAGAEQRAQEARRIAGEVKFPPPLISATLDLMFNYTRRGEPAQAEPLVDEVAASIAGAAGWHAWLWDLRFAEARAELALALGDYDEALRHAGEAFRLSEQKSRVKYCAAALVTRGRALDALGRRDEALADLRRAVAVAKPVGDPAMLLRAAAPLVEHTSGAEGLSEARSAVAAIERELPAGALADAFRASAAVQLLQRARA